MTIHPFFQGLIWGAIAMTFAGILAVHNNNNDWQREAFKHYAAIYVQNRDEGSVRWMWFDDYARTVLLPKAKEKAYHPPATPRPDSIKM